MDAASMAGELFNMLVGNPKFVTIMTGTLSVNEMMHD
jgi:hypothetical protein